MNTALKRKTDIVKDRNVENYNERTEECFYCKRDKPIFLYDSDNQIMRLPDRVLSPFLLQLKADFKRKKEYLKFLRLNSRSIRLCKCETYQTIHAYCATASIL